MIYFIFMGISFITGGIIKIAFDIPVLFILCGLFGIMLFFVFFNLMLRKSTSIATLPPQPCPSPATPTPCVAIPAPTNKSYSWLWIGLVALIIAGLVFYSASDKPKSDDTTINKKTPSEGTLADPHESWQSYLMSRGLL